MPKVYEILWERNSLRIFISYIHIQFFKDGCLQQKLFSRSCFSGGGVFLNVLTRGTFAPVDPFACPSNEEKISTFVSVAYKIGPFFICFSLVNKTISLMLLAKMKSSPRMQLLRWISPIWLYSLTKIVNCAFSGKSLPLCSFADASKQFFNDAALKAGT